MFRPGIESLCCLFIDDRDSWQDLTEAGIGHFDTEPRPGPWLTAGYGLPFSPDDEEDRILLGVGGFVGSGAISLTFDERHVVTVAPRADRSWASFAIAVVVPETKRQQMSFDIA